MAKYLRKQNERLNARIKDWNASKSNSKVNPERYTRPGSMAKKK